jgi:acyl carrier protein
LITEKHTVLQEFIQARFASGMAEPIGYDDDLLMSGVLDSLNVMSLLAFIQQRFDIKVPAEDVIYDHFININAIVGYLDSK